MNIQIHQAYDDSNRPIYRKHESGVALIVVLLVLVLISLVGAMAVRQSATDLKIATADQIDTMLLQSSDGAYNDLEKTINTEDTDPNYAAYEKAYNAMLSGGMLWFFLEDARAAGSEYTYCYNTNLNKYSLSRATIRASAGGILYNNGGICNYKDPKSYTNGRQTVITQVSITTEPTNNDTEAFRHLVQGIDTDSSSSRKALLDVRSTSILPSYGEPDNCMSSSSIKNATGKDTPELLNCLQGKNTPSKMLFENIEIANDTDVYVCRNFGKGDKTLTAEEEKECKKS